MPSSRQVVDYQVIVHTYEDPELLMGLIPCIDFWKAQSRKHLSLRELAVLPGYERVPTVAETFHGFNFTGWMMLVAPTGTPSGVVSRLNREMQPIMSDPEIVGRLRDIGFFTGGAGTPESAAAFINSQYDAWGRVVREIGIQPE